MLGLVAVFLLVLLAFVLVLVVAIADVDVVITGGITYSRTIIITLAVVLLSSSLTSTLARLSLSHLFQFASDCCCSHCKSTSSSTHTNP